MHNPWITEIARSSFAIIGFGLTGYVFNQTALGIIFGLIVCIFISYQQFFKYSKWLNNEELEDYSDDEGIIDSLYYRALYLQKRHKDKEHHLEHVIRKFQETARAIPDALIILNENNEVEWLNKAARNLVGLKRNKDTGQTISNLIRHPSFTHYLMRMDFKYPVELPSPVDRNIQISAHIIPYGKDLRLLIIRDVTQLHNLEKMRQEFIASTSHELRTPLTVITGYLESIQQLKPSDAGLEGMEDIINAMLDQSIRMESIISDMLMLARLEALKNHKDRARKPVNIAKLIETISENTESTSAGKHNFELNIDRKLNLLGIENDLYSVFSNLIQNATHYTPDGSTIKISWYEKKGTGYFVVEDDGPGIAPEHIPRLTERFYRVDISRSRESGGTGLGLAIVHQIIKHHDGQLIIDSKVGLGSSFTCEFPAHLILNQESPQLQIMV